MVGLARQVEALGDHHLKAKRLEDVHRHGGELRVGLIESLVEHHGGKPKLSTAHRRAIELDYGMTDGRTVLTCRLALAFYVLRHLRLEADRVSTPEQQQIVLKNRASVDRTMSNAAAVTSVASR